MSLTMAQAQQQISGKLTNDGGSPIEFANIVILSNDSTFLTGTVSDLDGNFSVEKPADAHFVHISCIGYETLYKAIAEINDFQNIVLKNSSVELEEITVKAIAPKTQLKDGAMVTNVQGTILAQTGSTSRMLSNVPGLMCDKDGNLSVIGKGEPEIYINNVKVRDNKELESLTPENIKNVEVISSPGARYAADVKAVVRITTLKPVGDGFGFTAESYAMESSEDDWRVFQEKFNFNYRKNGLDIFGGGRIDINTKQRSKCNLYTLNNSNHKWENSNVVDNYGSNNFLPVNIGVNYQINDNNFVGARYNYKSQFNYKNYDKNVADIWCDGEAYDHLENFSTNSKNYDDQNSLNLYYNGKMGGFSVDFNSDFVYNTSETEAVTPEISQNYEDRELSNTNHVVSKLSAQKIVFGHELLGGHIDFGGETTITERTDETKSGAEQYIPSVKSLSKQKGVAGFAEYRRTFANKYNVSAGLRYEHIALDFYNSGEYDKDASKVYDELFPSATFSGQFGKINMQLAYSEKISRPSYFSMSNYVYYASRYLYQTGNPTLRPTIIRNAELTATYMMVQAKVSYTHSKNACIQYQTVNEAHPENEILNWINIDRPQLSMDIATQLPLGIYRPMICFVFQKQWIDDIESDGRKLSLNHPLCVLIFNNSLTLKNGWSLELNSQTMFKNGNMDLCKLHKTTIKADFFIHKSLLNNALNIELGISDLLNKGATNGMLYKQSGYLQQTNLLNNRQFHATVKYTFNPAKSKYKGTGAGNAEKERL